MLALSKLGHTSKFAVPCSVLSLEDRAPRRFVERAVAMHFPIHLQFRHALRAAAPR